MKKVEILSRKKIFDGFFKLEKVELRHERYDGSMSVPVSRLNVVRGDAVSAVLYHRKRDKLVFVEQFRYASYQKDNGWLLELVAGMVVEGESPECAIKREIYEELGYKVTGLLPIYCFYVAPGSCDEKIHLFYAEVDDNVRVGSGGGNYHEHEDIKEIQLAPTQISDMMDSGKIIDAKTLIGLQWFISKKLS